jgi:hypothetical protein
VKLQPRNNKMHTLLLKYDQNVKANNNGEEKTWKEIMYPDERGVEAQGLHSILCGIAQFEFEFRSILL